MSDLEAVIAVLRADQLQKEVSHTNSAEMAEQQLEKQLAQTQELKEQLREMEAGRDSFRAKFLELREMNKDLEMQIKQVQKECKAKLLMLEEVPDRDDPNDDCSLSTTKSFLTPADQTQISSGSKYKYTYKRGVQK